MYINCTATFCQHKIFCTLLFCHCCQRKQNPANTLYYTQHTYKSNFYKIIENIHLLLYRLICWVVMWFRLDIRNFHTCALCRIKKNISPDIILTLSGGGHVCEMDYSLIQYKLFGVEMLNCEARSCLNRVKFYNIT